MLTAHRWPAVSAWAGLCVCVGLTGCRREEPSEPTKADVPKIPVVAPEKTPAPGKPTPVLPALKPGEGVKPPVGEAPSAALTQPTISPSAARTTEDAAASVGVDGPDAADAPPFFRRDRIGTDWIKLKAVRTALPGSMSEIIPEKIAALIGPYQIKQAATCAYRFATRPKQVTRLLSIETHRPEDAYGIFTVLATGSLSTEPGELIRTDTGEDQLTVHVWKGRHYLRLTAQVGKDAELVDAGKGLIRRIAFLIPDASPPELVEALPQAGLAAGGIWLIRGWESLTGPGAAGLDVRGDDLGKVLGLNKDSLMAIATYRIKGAARPHLVWVVRYDRPEQASEAYKAYQAYLERATDPRSASTMLIRPRGQYLVGTWSAEEESLAPVLPKLRSNLE